MSLANHRNPTRLLSIALSIVVTAWSSSSIPAAAAESPAIVADVVYGHKDGLALTFDVFKPKEKANGAGLLFMVSGGWFSTWIPPEAAVPLFRPLTDKGFTVFAVRHGSAPRYNVPEAVEDVRRAVRYIRMKAPDWEVDAERLGVYGGSAGGHLSLMLGLASDGGDANSPDVVLRQSSRVACVVSIFPPTDLREMVPPPEKYKSIPALNFDPKKSPDVSPILHVSKDDPPTLLIHGDKDELVPIAHSENLQAVLKEQEVTHELMVVPGAGHGFAGADQVKVVDALIGWFEKHLAERK